MASFSENIMTLVNAGIDVSKIKTPAYASRLASGVRRAEQAGKAAPTRTALRGHARAPLEHLPKQGHRIEQMTVQGPQNMADLNHLLNRAKKPGPKKPYVFVIKGLVSKYPHATIGEAGLPKTITRKREAKGERDYIRENRQGDYAELLQWANSLLEGSEWIAIYSISVAYPSDKELK
jgi:hypothetical protein